MTTHIEFETIHGEKWIIHKDNVKAVNIVNTPDAFIEEWKEEKVVIITSTEVNDKDNKPWQFMVADSYESIREKLTNSVTSENKVPV